MKLLFLTSEPVVESGSVSRFPGQAIKAESSSYVTHSYMLQSGALPKDTYNLIKFLSNIAHTSEVYAELLSSLVAGGRLEAVETGQQGTQHLEKELTLAGFVNCKTTLFPTGEQVVEAAKPAWKAGATAIKLKPKAAPSWTMSAEDDELVDEDDLLTEEDKQRPAVTAADCGVSTTKKACKNCTCGRAEGKIEVELTPELLENPSIGGGCGSCGLGDAFRCGTCPYRGLPAFEMGKKIELPKDFLMADV